MGKRLQRIDRVAEREELEVALDRGRTLVKDALGESDCRREAGRVLVYVERAVEVRNARPLVLDFVVDHDLITEVEFDNRNGRYCRLYFKQVFKIN